MVCSECKATIADKAIVCYRCGAPTAIPTVARQAPTPQTRRSPVPAILSTAAALGLGWFSFEADPGTTERMASAVAALVSLAGGGLLALRRKR